MKPRHAAWMRVAASLCSIKRVAVDHGPHSSVLMQLLLPGSFMSMMRTLMSFTSAAVFLPLWAFMSLIVGRRHCSSLNFCLMS